MGPAIHPVKFVAAISASLSPQEVVAALHDHGNIILLQKITAAYQEGIDANAEV
jgi:hypothetical protein